MQHVFEIIPTIEWLFNDVAVTPPPHPPVTVRHDIVTYTTSGTVAQVTSITWIIMYSPAVHIVKHQGGMKLQVRD